MKYILHLGLYISLVVVSIIGLVSLISLDIIESSFIYGNNPLGDNAILWTLLLTTVVIPLPIYLIIMLVLSKIEKART